MSTLAEWPDDYPLHYRNTVVQGDAFVLWDAVPDESVDLAYSDPVYENVEDYRRLAEWAARALKPNGSLLVWCSGMKQYDVHAAVSPILKFVMPFYYCVNAKAAKMRAYNVYVWTTPVLLFTKGNFRAASGTPDTIYSFAPPTKDASHVWNKNPMAYEPWLCALTRPGDLVVDPFAGTGPIGMVALRNGRRYTGFEQQEKHVEAARVRLQSAQARLVDAPVALEQGFMFEGMEKKEFADKAKKRKRKSPELHGVVDGAADGQSNVVATEQPKVRRRKSAKAEG